MNNSSQLEKDQFYMARAIELGRQNLGKTFPNPTVGCLVVLNDEVIAEAVTGEGGKPHAEEAALELLSGKDLSEAVVYVTLEPCYSRSSGAAGCSDRLIAAEVGRVVVAQKDPHPTARHGIEKLKAFGVVVDIGILADQASELTIGFFTRLNTGRPYVQVSETGTFADTKLTVLENESVDEALLRLGNQGITRVWVKTNSILEAELRDANILR